MKKYKTYHIYIYLGLFLITFLTNISFISLSTQKIKNDVLDLSQNISILEKQNKFANSKENIHQKISAIIDYYNPELLDDLKQQIIQEIYKMDIKYVNLNLDLICAVITHESAKTWKPDIKSRAGAMGLMQIMPRTGKQVTKRLNISWTKAEEILFNPIKNIQIGSYYLSYLIGRFGLEGGLAAYNGGATRVIKWLNNNKNKKFLYQETRNYVPAVILLYEKYSKIQVEG